MKIPSTVRFLGVGAVFLWLVQGRCSPTVAAQLAPIEPAYAPIHLHPDNPHYLVFRGQPTVLITAGEHYGAVINLDFDYLKYLDALAANEMNLTRLFVGTYLEASDSINFLKPGQNTLAPQPERYLAPWRQTPKPGAVRGGNKYDLTQWNDAYFSRLRDFIDQGGRRGIVVSVVFESNHYHMHEWELSPLFMGNNVNGVGDCGFESANTLFCKPLVAAQETLLRKLVRELNAFDNVLLEVCNEPQDQRLDVREWQDYLAGVIVHEEGQLPNRHLLSVNISNLDHYLVRPFTINPLFSVYNFHYVFISPFIGAMRGLALLYDNNRVLGFDETKCPPMQTEVSGIRYEAWEFIIGGGGIYNNLNCFYTVGNPAGDDPENQEILNELKALKQFIHSLDFVRMRRAREIVTGGIPEDATCSVLAEKGKQYAVYVHHGRYKAPRVADLVVIGASYEKHVGEHQLKISLEVPPATYRCEWLNPATLKVIGESSRVHAAGTLTIESPTYAEDIVLRMTAK